LRELAAAWWEDAVVRHTVAAWRDWVMADGARANELNGDDAMKKHRINQVVRSKGGAGHHVAQLRELSVPDCWHAATKLRAAGHADEAEVVLEAWHLCHDLLDHARKVENLTDEELDSRPPDLPIA
jgi:hypothetical protein